MKPVGVQFVKKTPQILYWSLATTLALLAVATVQSWSIWKDSLTQQRAALRVTDQEQRFETLRQQDADFRRAKLYAADANDAARQADFPIELALSALEHVTVPGVKVVSLEVRPDLGTAMAEIEFQNQQALGIYLRSLSNLDVPHRWQLQSIRVESSPSDVASYSQTATQPANPRASLSWSSFP